MHLLRYDPAGITDPAEPGYAAGSGAPEHMLGYLKYLWAAGDRHDCLRR